MAFLIVICVVMLIVLLLLTCGGRLLPTWMFLNSLSLLAHLPLLGVMMPANLHYFLQQWLNVFVLRNYNLKYELEIWREPLGIKNYEMAEEEKTSYHLLLNDCGYKHTYARNLLLLFIIGCAIFLIWAIFYIRAKCGKRCRSNAPKDEEKEVKSNIKT